jgi:hypothetical protein
MLSLPLPPPPPNIIDRADECRTLAASTFTLSLLVQSYLIPFQNVNLNLQAAFLKLPPQIWRLFTALLITGPHMWLLFDTYFCKYYFAVIRAVDRLC